METRGSTNFEEHQNPLDSMLLLPKIFIWMLCPIFENASRRWHYQSSYRQSKFFLWLGSNVGACIMFMLEGLNELIKFSQSQYCFVCDFVVVIKFYQVNLHHQYNDLQDAYMNNVFNGYRNLLNGTSNVMVHEWAPRIWILVGWKQKKKSQAMCEQSLKIVFWKFEKSPWDIIYQK